MCECELENDNWKLSVVFRPKENDPREQYTLTPRNEEVRGYLN